MLAPSAESAILVAVCAVAVLCGGVVKGITGVGLPTVAIPLMVLLLPAPMAISLMLVPVLASNILQINDLRLALGALIRFWPLILLLIAGTVIGAQVMIGADPHTMQIGLGVVILGLVAFQELHNRTPRPLASERLWSPLVGLVAGLLGGISSFSGPPLVAYLLRLRLPSRTFVVTISLFYVCSALPLYVSLYSSSNVGSREFAASLALSAPAYGGLVLGRRLRERLDERQFRRAITAVLLLSGLSLLGKAFLR